MKNKKVKGNEKWRHREFYAVVVFRHIEKLYGFTAIIINDRLTKLYPRFCS